MIKYGALSTTDPMPSSPLSLPDEPVIEIKDIQGNVFPGFNKDFQTFISLRIEDAGAAKGWLRAIAPTISTVEEVLAFNRLFRALRARQGHEPRGLVATWTNIAFSYSGLKKLVPSYTGAEKVHLLSVYRVGPPFLAIQPTPVTKCTRTTGWLVGQITSRMCL